MGEIKEVAGRGRKRTAPDDEWKNSAIDVELCEVLEAWQAMGVMSMEISKIFNDHVLRNSNKLLRLAISANTVALKNAKVNNMGIEDRALMPSTKEQDDFVENIDRMYRMQRNIEIFSMAHEALQLDMEQVMKESKDVSRK